jgi:hypothetical protein
MATTAEEVLKQHGFTRQRTQDGLDGYRVATYSNGRIAVEIGEWSDGDWDYIRSYTLFRSNGSELSSVYPMLREVKKQSRVRTERIGLVIEPHNSELYDLRKYESAFALLGQGGNYKTQVPDFIRQAMVFVALNLDFEANVNKESVQNLFGSTSGLQWNDTAVLACLKEIRQIGPR